MNPGTSEMQFVSALDRVSGLRPVLCLFEGVCSGAADGYARMLGRPASTLLHLGPGLGNGLANFHNARKARSPILSLVGEHATGHLRHNAPLTADIEAFARTVSGYVYTVESAGEIGEAASRAIAAAMEPPGQIATLIVPADFSWDPSRGPGPVVEPCRRPQVPLETLREVRRLLVSGEPVGLLLSGSALLENGLEAAGRLAAATGVRVFSHRFCARLERGGGLFAPRPIPYFPEPAEAALAGLKHLVLVESEPPVSFFAYPGRRSGVAPADCNFTVLATPERDGAAALQALAGELARKPAAFPTPSRPDLAEGAPFTADTIGRVIGALLPDGAIVSDEAVSSGAAIWPHLAAVRHTHLPVSGGSIGQGLPVALGAALACPDRKVLCLEADGSGMYTLQALWTMAREQLDIVTVVFANRRYRILEIEILRTGATEVGSAAAEMVDISRPDLDWVKLAEAQGVPATRAVTTDEFIAQFRAAVSDKGPRLIEAVIS